MVEKDPDPFDADRQSAGKLFDWDDDSGIGAKVGLTGVEKKQPEPPLSDPAPALVALRFTGRQQKADDLVYEGMLRTEDDRILSFGFSRDDGVLWLDEGEMSYNADNTIWHLAQGFIEARRIEAEREVAAAKEEQSRQKRKEAHDRLMRDAFNPRVVYEANLKQAQSFKPNRLRVLGGPLHLSMVKRWFGVTKASGSTVYFSAEPGFSFGIISVEGLDPRPSQDIDQSIVLRREVRDVRPCFVVVEGSAQFLRPFRQLQEPDVVIFVNPDPDVLKKLGCEVVDEEWSEDRPQFDLDTIILQTVTAKQTRPIEVQAVPKKAPATPAPKPQATVASTKEAPRVATRQPVSSGESNSKPPPKTVQRSSKGGEVTRSGADLMSQFGMGGGPRPGTVDMAENFSASSGLGMPVVEGEATEGMEISDDEMAARAKLVAEGRIEPLEGLAVEEEAETVVSEEQRAAAVAGFTAGQRIKELIGGVEGSFVQLREDDPKLAVIDFDDKPEGELDTIPLDEIEPL